MRHGPRAVARRLLARRTGAALVMFLTLGPAVIAAAPAAEASTASAAVAARYQTRVIQLINGQRVRYGRGRLSAAACPDWYAVRWAHHLASTGAFYHQSMYTILAGCRAHVAAENLAKGDVSADVFVAMWMKSPGHRANILDGRLSRIGVSAVFSHGYWVVAADFTCP